MAGNPAVMVAVTRRVAAVVVDVVIHHEARARHAHLATVTATVWINAHGKRFMEKNAPLNIVS